MKKLLLFMVIAALLAACSGSGEPDRVTVQHILIAFDGKVPMVQRTQDEAQALAMEVFEKAKAGEDYDALVKEYTDDRYPGKYTMVNTDVEPLHDNEIPRQNLVKAFGDIGFKLKVGDIGLANYDPQTSPYGWHIIKRIE